MLSMAVQPNPNAALKSYTFPMSSNRNHRLMFKASNALSLYSTRSASTNLRFRASPAPVVAVAVSEQSSAPQESLSASPLDVEVLSFPFSIKIFFFNSVWLLRISIELNLESYLLLSLLSGYVNVRSTCWKTDFMFLFLYFLDSQTEALLKFFNLSSKTCLIGILKALFLLRKALTCLGFAIKSMRSTSKCFSQTVAAVAETFFHVVEYC